LAGISGANFNPAVSLALGLSKAMGGPGINFADVGTYTCVQVVAGTVAAICYELLFFDTFNLAPAPGFGLLHVALCEILYTCMLCFVVLNVAVAKNNTPNRFYGLAIGYVIVAGAYGAGAVSGGCFNPAVAIGIDVASAGMGLSWCLAYMVFEAIGVVLAVLLFRLVRPEDFNGQKSAATDLLSEFLGTYVLVLTVGLNVLGKSAAGAFSISAALMCMVFALGNVSGAHFNPAVTLAIWCSGRCADLKMSKAIMYVIVQLLAAVAAAFTYSLIYKGETFPLGPGSEYSLMQACMAETLFTLILCYTVLCVAASSVTKAPMTFGLVIGACITVGGNAIGVISGGVLNPAVSFGLATAHLQAGGGLLEALAYSLAELLGAIVASAIFSVTHAVDNEKSERDALKEQA